MRRQLGRASFGVAAAVIAGAVLVGCGSSATPDSASSAPSSVPVRPVIDDWTVVWTPTEALDLMSSEGTYLRAVAESVERAGVSGDISRAFPGFVDVPSGHFRGEYDEWFEVRAARATTGTRRFWVQDVVRRTPMTVSAVICQDTSGTAGFGNGTWTTGRIPSGRRIEVSKDENNLPPARQSGPAATPEVDVFGSWRTTRVTNLVGESPCGPVLDETTRTTPPPKLPASPGWPSRDGV